ncbi:MAG: GNAT family N-acetyltransferase [Halalkalicoccus sp.]|nr:GNAT family N-acetyltransferase [Halalkalicoccus sp.]
MIREARKGECEAVMRVVEGALLEVDPEGVREAIAAGDAFVAVNRGHVKGALVLDGARIEAIAVGRTHRGRGIGSALVERAAERGPLSAGFRPAVRPFYESLGFEIEREEGSEKRCRGRLSGPR